MHACLRVCVRLCMRVSLFAGCCLCGAWLSALSALVRVIERPRLLVLSGGIEFQRSERMIACLDTLVEAEERYMEV